VLVAAAIAVPLSATLQYRWVSELGAAQRTEQRQSWVEAVVRSATAINKDLSAFYASVLMFGQVQPDVARFERALKTWREGAITLGPLARAYIHERRTGRWLAVTGASQLVGVEEPESLENAIADVPFSASWLAPTQTQALPAMVISLERGAGFNGVLLIFANGACERLLRVLAERHFASESDVRLAVVEDAPARRAICSNGRFEPADGDEGRAAVFRLQPPALLHSRADANQDSVGIVMSQDSGRVTWELSAQKGGDALAFTVRRVQRRNLWMAAGLELTLVAAIIAIAAGARRARQTASAHVKFSAVVAHELRTPLAAIKVLAQNQARGLVRRDEQVVQYGNTIAAEADRLHAFVECVLQFTGGRTSSKSARSELVDFERVLSSALNPLQQRIATSGLTVQSAVESAARMTLGDEGALVLAVRNLVQNALDHAEGARAIVINVRVRERYVVIAVSDDGAGIPESERGRLFEPFVRGSRTRERISAGHGLGLAIVRDVALAHGGRAKYEAVSPGSVFTFTVRLRATDSAER
jgi:signal transduction histidine kinase